VTKAVLRSNFKSTIVAPYRLADYALGSRTIGPGAGTANMVSVVHTQ
jgi:hypothetical protein